jgi:integrase
MACGVESASYGGRSSLSRRLTGSVYVSRGAWFLALSLGKRVHFRLSTCQTRPQAELRQRVICGLVDQLRSSGNDASILAVCHQAAEVDDALLPAIVQLVAGLATGAEKLAPVQPSRSVVEGATHSMTLREFGNLWTTNELARQYRGRVREIDQSENARRLAKHVYPIQFRGRAVGDIPLSEFSLDAADHVLAQPTLPAGSLRHVAQCLHRLLKLAVYPVRLLPASPFPPGWLPPAMQTKERAYLFPAEDAQLMACPDVPLVWRLLFGFLAREGVRREDAASIEWQNLALDASEASAHIVLDRTKNGRGGAWALDPGTTSALRLWRGQCPSEKWVFPTEALPRFRRRRAGQHLHVDHAGEILREALQAAGVTRPKLFEANDHRLRLRAHDLRATFVTLALANGRSEDWVMQRTGHRSSIMLARYRRDAETAHELGLGWLRPLSEIIPELAAFRSTASLSAAYHR